MEIFRHIQYATAERFGEPEITDYSEGTANQNMRTACHQPAFRLGFLMGDTEPMSMSEECHFLNIWTPSKEGNFPVLVWIHGGAYVAGSGEESAYDGAALCSQGNIVVVTISYRLGIFGYLHNHKNGAVNLGLKDQIAALRWVKAHIRSFGGDPENITLAGQSAGGHSVAAIISTCTEPLFKKAIIQSAPLSMLTSSSEAEAIYNKACKYCQEPLEQADTDVLLHVQKEIMKESKSMMPFAPLKPDFSGKVTIPSLEKVLITWQKDDAAPFVAMKLNHQDKFGSLIDKIATRIATKIVFENPAKKYALALQKHGITTETRCLEWIPGDSTFGACHCLELSLLFGSWERWQDTKMLGDISKGEWEKQSHELRNIWISFIK